MTGPLRYFAYGSNLDAAQMRSRCPGAVPVSAARLDGWRFRIGHRGYATIHPATDGVVWGGIWDVTDDHLAALDRHEGVAQGIYRRERLTVWVDDATVDAIVYIEEHVEDGPPKPGYLDRILRGAAEFDLPEPYRADLARLADPR